MRSVIDHALGKALCSDRLLESVTCGEVDHLEDAVDGAADGRAVATLEPGWEIDVATPFAPPATVTDTSSSATSGSVPSRPEALWAERRRVVSRT